MTELSNSARDVVGSFDALQDTTDKKAVLTELQTANKDLIPASNEGKLDLWKMLFVLFGIIAIILAVGAVWCLLVGKDTAASILVAPITAIVTGMFGLFAVSPMSSSG
ncbi:MAG TPA: hypothetical protein VHU62_05280 [Mycobacterium sp.]|nr:hypothetical protein [Mycobacterium sp.]